MIEHLLDIRSYPSVTQLASRLNLSVYSDEWKEVHFKSWAHFSGDAVVPFFAFISHIDLWDIETEYGRLRWHLLEHLINEYSK